MSMHRRRSGLLTLLAGSMLLLFSVDARAIPAFARKYATSCQTCHVGFPKLNPFGEAFRLNGYHLPKETEEQIKIPQVSLGADANKKMFPRTMWPSDLPGQVPLALNVKMASVYASSLDDTGRTLIKNDFQFPQEANLFAGGTLGERMSFLGEVTWAENPDGSSSTELERLHLAIGPFADHLVNFKVGKFAADLNDGFHEMWLSTDNGIDTLFAFNPVGLNGGTGLAEDGGGIALPGDVKGIEIYGVGAHRFFYTAGVVNGLGPSASGSTDANASKDLYARADYKLGGMGLDGDTTGVTLPPENWREHSLRVGVLGYRGNGKGFDFPFEDAGVTIQDRNFTRAGVYASWMFNDLNIFGVALSGRDKLDTFDGEGALVNSASHTFRSWFVQGDYVFVPPLQGSLRYESVRPGDTEVRTLRFLNASLAYFAYANVKAMLEYRRDLNEAKNYQLATILRFAF
ncbi:MAG TPA: hypothetical protein VF980_11405 [Thermoanaerobaculia bacterium]